MYNDRLNCHLVERYQITADDNCLVWFVLILQCSADLHLHVCEFVLCSNPTTQETIG